jgi:transketolase
MQAMREAFLAELLDRMGRRDDIFFLTADFGSPQLDKMQSAHPDRFLNVGIAEQNLINVALGLALEGFCVYAYAIAPFLTMRCYEQIRVGLALHSQLRPVNVNLVGVGAGMSYEVSGPTHHCLEDLAIMGVLPHMEIHAPSDAKVAALLVDHTLGTCAPKYIRMEGKALPDLDPPVTANDMAAGFRVIRPGRRLILAMGYMVHKALRIADRFPFGEIGVVDLMRPKPMVSDELKAVMGGAESLLTLEEGFLGSGGLDGMTSHFLRENGLSIPMKAMGLRDHYLFDIGSREYLHQRGGIGDEAIVAALRLGFEGPVGDAPA